MGERASLKADTFKTGKAAGNGSLPVKRREIRGGFCGAGLRHR